MNNKSVLHSVYAALLMLLVALTNFAYLPFGVDHFEYPKFVALLIIGTLTLFTVILFGFQTIKDQFPKTGLIFLGTYWVGQIGAFLGSSDYVISFVGAPFRYQGLYANLIYTGILFASFHLFSQSTDELCKKILQIIGAIGTIASVVAICSYSDLFFSPKLSLGRAYGTFGQPNYLASLLIVALPTLWLYRNRTITYVAALITLTALFLTGSRAAWIATVTSLIGVGFIVWRKNGTKQLVYIGCTIIGLAAAAFTINFISPHKVLKRFSMHGQEKVSIVARLDLWRAGGKLITNRPFFGYGQDMLATYLPPYLPPEARSGPRYYDRIHSEPFDILATSGIFSFVGYLGLTYVCLFYFVKRILNSKSATTELVCTFALASLFIYHGFNFSTVTSSVLWSVLQGTAFASMAKVNTRFEESVNV